MKKSGDHNYGECTRAFGALSIAHALVSTELEQALQDAADLSINEFDVLVGLDEASGKALPLSALGSVVRLSQPAMSRLVARLEGRDLVQRITDEDDRRSFTLKLTKLGAETLKRAVPAHARCIQEKLLAQLTPHERDVFRAVLIKIAKANTPPQ
jgi:DNA-binding MarR family transcriptional regulator